MRAIDADKIVYYDDEQGFEMAYKVDIDALPTLTPPNEWVSVEDRLPEVFTPVLVCREDGKVEQGCRDALGIWITFETRTECVTHWMPLPARPPEGKED